MKLVRLKCKNCNKESNPWRWYTRDILGFIFAFVNFMWGYLWIVPTILYFVLTNQYVCKECGKRDKLTKIFDDNSEKNVKSWSKEKFIIGYIVISLLSIILFILITKSSPLEWLFTNNYRY